MEKGRPSANKWLYISYWTRPVSSFHAQPKYYLCVRTFEFTSIWEINGWSFRKTSTLFLSYTILYTQHGSASKHFLTLIWLWYSRYRIELENWQGILWARVYVIVRLEAGLEAGTSLETFSNFLGDAQVFARLWQKYGRSIWFVSSVPCLWTRGLGRVQPKTVHPRYQGTWRKPFPWPTQSQRSITNNYNVCLIRTFIGSK